VTLKALVFRYGAFAVVAILANLAAQRLVLSGGESGYVLSLAIACGTIVGLVVKYWLDKRWIFYHLSSSLSNDGKTFALYTVMGILTTFIFWGTETGFWLIWRTDLMRELGAIIGLTVGYIVKYNLDRRFVFTNSKMVQS
jgi:putative flippase GtrA